MGAPCFGDRTASTRCSGRRPCAARGAYVRCRRQQAFFALVSSLNAGDLPGAQQAYSSLNELQDNAQGRFANPNRPLAQALNQIGQSLQSGDLTGAQQTLSSLRVGRRGPRQP
jgi:hypothetical protein